MVSFRRATKTLREVVPWLHDVQSRGLSQRSDLMSPQAQSFSMSDRSSDSIQRVDEAVSETVITLATAGDRQRLRAELLRLIIRNEARRKQSEFHGLGTTDGSANSPNEAVDS